MYNVVLESHESLEKRKYAYDILYKTIIRPILNTLPSRAQVKIRKSHKFADEVIEHKTSHKALDIIYSDKYADTERSHFKKISYYVWRHTDNVIGVRNRLRLVKREIASTLNQITTPNSDETVSILSIAAGSSRSILEVLVDHKCEHLKKIEIEFLDKNPQALNYSKLLAAQYQDSFCACYSFFWHEGNANAFLESLPSAKKYDVVEMVGLLDYFDDKKVVTTLQNIRSHLKQGGVLLTGNILPNKEQRFITNVVGWKMMYRTPAKMFELSKMAGFERENVRIFVEPLGVHGLLVGQRT